MENRGCWGERLDTYDSSGAEGRRCGALVMTRWFRGYFVRDGKEAGTARGCWETYYGVEKLEEGEGEKGVSEGGDRVCD